MPARRELLGKPDHAEKCDGQLACLAWKDPLPFWHFNLADEKVPILRRAKVVIWPVFGGERPSSPALFCRQDMNARQNRGRLATRGTKLIGEDECA